MLAKVTWVAAADRQGKEEGGRKKVRWGLGFEQDPRVVDVLHRP